MQPSVCLSAPIETRLKSIKIYTPFDLPVQTNFFRVSTTKGIHELWVFVHDVVEK